MKIPVGFLLTGRKTVDSIVITTPRTSRQSEILDDREKIMKATLRVWSEIGNTPLTKRAGSYCDELAKVEIEVDGPVEAKAALKDLMLKTPHAADGHFEVPEFWNQNTRSGSMSIRDARRV